MWTSNLSLEEQCESLWMTAQLAPSQRGVRPERRRPPWGSDRGHYSEQTRPHPFGEVSEDISPVVMARVDIPHNLPHSCYKDASPSRRSARGADCILCRPVSLSAS